MERKVIRRSKYRLSFAQHVLRRLKRRSTLGYQTEQVGPLTLAYISAPFHSAHYGTCAMSTKPDIALALLVRKLANDGGFFGTLVRKPDESDRRLLDPHPENITIDQ